MSMRFALEALPPAMRAQAEAQLRAGATIRTHSHDEMERLAIPKPNKYRAKKCELDGKQFDSLKEANHWRELRLREHAGEIAELRHQVPFELKVNGVEVCVYIADMTYREDGRLRVVDIKGYKKGQAYRMFKVKSALMKALHRIEVEEV